MRRTYDPLRAPDPKKWLALDEEERTDRILRYHQQLGVEMPNEQVHALFHLIVENQAALRGETPVAATLERLVREDGLDRHEAIHAVASVLTKYVWEILQSNEQTPDAYFDEVRTLTVEKWISEFGE